MLQGECLPPFSLSFCTALISIATPSQAHTSCMCAQTHTSSLIKKPMGLFFFQNESDNIYLRYCTGSCLPLPKFLSASVHFHIMLPSHWMNRITSLWQARSAHTNPHKPSQANSNHTPMHTLQGCPQLGCSCIGNVALQQHIQCGRSTLAAAPASLSTPTAPQRAWPLHSAKPNPLDPLWTRALGTTPTSAVCTLHPASCDEILMSLGFFVRSWAHHGTRGHPTPCACFLLYSVPVL